MIELEKEKGEVRGIDIASKLGISKASVSEMLRKLEKHKLVSIKPYSKVALTAFGKKEAVKIIEKYEMIREFVKKALKLEENNANDEAHILEHALSENSMDRIREIMGKKEKERQETEKELVYVG